MTDYMPAENKKVQEFVSFRVGKQEFCIDIMAVREIRGWTPATPIPHAPSYIRGVINLRGAVLPIIDLALRLGLPSNEPAAHHVIIVTKIGDRLAGILVDAVSDILTAEESIIQATPDVASLTAKTFVRGVMALEGRMVSIMTLENILPSAEREAA